MTVQPTVYLDANVYKFAATRLLRVFPREQTVTWGNRTVTTTVDDFGYLNPNERILNTDLKAEAGLLQKVANMAKSGRLILMVQSETQLETWGLPNMDSEDGPMYGAPVVDGDAPIHYARIVAGGGESADDYQLDFLRSLRDSRFLELQRATGAYQGAGRLNSNQLLDAFHLWCAEHNHCDYFLTLDFKLQRVLKRSSMELSVSVVRPSELLQAAGLE